jgi:hypothetical protein
MSKSCNFDDFKSEGLHDMHTVAIWNLGTISTFPRRQWTVTENKCLIKKGKTIPVTSRGGLIGL